MFRMGYDDFWRKETSLELGLNVFMMTENFKERTHYRQKQWQESDFVWLENKV